MVICFKLGGIGFYVEIQQNQMITKTTKWKTC